MLEVYKARLEKYLSQKNAFTDALNQVEEKTGVQKLYIVYGGSAIIILWLLIGYGASFLASFIGFVYPAYCSVKAIETHEKEDDTKWLIYWVVYASFSLLEFFTDIFLWWIPLYAFMKCAFLVYCMLPIERNGSVVLYNRVIRPLVLRHQDQIDDAMSRAVGMAGEIVGEAQKGISDAVAEQAAAAVKDSLAASGSGEVTTNEAKLD